MEGAHRKTDQKQWERGWEGGGGGVEAQKCR